MNPLANYPTERLTWLLSEKGKAQGELERQWTIAENQRLAVLAEITTWYEGSHTAGEAWARTTKEYQEFLAKMGEIKKQLVEARNKTKAVELEIRVRLNKSYTERVEYKAGSLT